MLGKTKENSLGRLEKESNSGYLLGNGANGSSTNDKKPNFKSLTSEILKEGRWSSGRTPPWRGGDPGFESQPVHF